MNELPLVELKVSQGGSPRVTGVRQMEKRTDQSTLVGISMHMR